MSRTSFVVASLLLAVALPARAQFGGVFDSAVRKAERAAEKAADDAAKGKPAQTAEKAKPAPAEAKGKQGAPDEEGAAAAEEPATGEVYGNRYDFVPGDKVLVYDDFSDTDVGEYPAKWTIKDGGGNALEVVELGGRRWLKSRYQAEDQDSAITWLRYAVKGDMPKNFTIEFDQDLAGPTQVLFSARYGFGGERVKFNGDDGTVVSANANGKLPARQGIKHVAIAVSGTQVKVYVGGERVLSDPDGVERPVKKLGMEFLHPYQKAGDHQMFTAYRLAEGGKPAKQMLAGEGKIITHGILFDTGSDVIKPESGPTLRMIQSLLTEDPALRFSIEGHTDNVGSPKSNLALSERRAAAVKAWLVKEGIDAGRLATKGLGDTKPIDGNDTAEGRANNRRVEFVKQVGRS
jgi:OmpA-OmpF porin, OOP family